MAADVSSFTSANVVRRFQSQKQLGGFHNGFTPLRPTYLPFICREIRSLKVSLYFVFRRKL